MHIKPHFWQTSTFQEFSVYFLKNRLWETLIFYSFYQYLLTIEKATENSRNVEIFQNTRSSVYLLTYRVEIWLWGCYVIVLYVCVLNMDAAFFKKITKEFWKHIYIYILSILFRNFAQNLKSDIIMYDINVFWNPTQLL